MNMKLLPILGMLILAVTMPLQAQQVFVSEDFSSASGSTPPTGWTNVIDQGDPTFDVWVFDNPGFRSLNAPISDPAAIFDSDWYSSSGGAEDVSLETPTFDASSASVVTLEFDHYFLGGFGGAYEVEVYNGFFWTSVLTGTATTANPQTESIDLSPYAAGYSTVQVRFRWTGDYSYYWIVDNVEIFEPQLVDIEVNAIASLSGCLGSQETISTRLKQKGSGTLDFAVNPVTLYANVSNGGNVQNFSTTVNTGTLNAGDSLDVTITNVADLSIVGVYDIELIGTAQGIAANPNDTTSFQVENAPVYASPLPVVDFTGYTGSNLSSLSTGWYEARGVNFPASVGADSWVDDDFLNDGSHPNGISAKINLYSDTREDWIVSPKFTATATTNLIYELGMTDYSSSNPGIFGSDDFVKVMISTDCGSSYTALVTYDLNNSISHLGQTDTIDLSFYMGQDIIVAFYASEGQVNDPEDNDIFLDNIEIKEILNYDMANATSDVTESGCGFTAMTPVTVEYANSGVLDIPNAEASFSVDGGPFTAPESIGLVVAGTSGSFTFTATADFSAPGAHTLVTIVTTTSPADQLPANDTITQTIFHVPTISTFPFVEDFETFPTYWVVEGSNPSWEWGIPSGGTLDSASSGVSVWATNLSGNYNNSEQSALVTPCFDLSGLSGEVMVGMDLWLDTESSYDGLVFQSSIDGGASWQRVGELNDLFNWYNQDGINGNPGGQDTAWAGASGGWFRAVHALDTSLVGMPSVKFRFAFGSDGSVSYEGVLFDNFAIGTAPVVSLGASDTINTCLGETLDLGFLPNGQYSWSTGDSTQTITLANATGANITDSTIIGVAVDTLGFFTFDTVTVNIPASAVDAALTIGDTISCAGDSTASLYLAATDGVMPYSYAWNNAGPATTDTLEGITAGMYSVTVTDAYGCTATDSVEIVEPDSLAFTNVTVMDVDCYGDTDGMIDITVEGGITPYTFLWSDGSTSEDLVGVGYGTYSGTITDVNGCELASGDVTIVYQDSLPIADFTYSVAGGEVTFDATSTGDSVSWDFGDGNMGGNESTTIHTYAQNDTFKVTLEVLNDCGSTTVVKTINLTTVGLNNDLLAGNIKMHPNPASAWLTLEFEALPQGNWDVKVFSMDGRTVVREQLTSTQGTFNQRLSVKHLAQGVYTVQIVSEAGSWTRKLSIK
ncbi:T9SS-dependent choice-of-anchor J family protein [Pontibacter sp. G13]|uniref:T9SS-dependent choice-of-anchor J family protein n=1 Tax=Pontibacter sp. G13 TaxID=3074898 RepID=UPI0028899E1A|nr:T9SS type A sorting domain-containing protein [Pontibacter sp. G13]WNJ18403.1 T9SS type A sorting domain-containing protein [Pontibacter sp. G13]